MTYNIVKTIDGQHTGSIINGLPYDTIEDAHADLIAEMAIIADRSDFVFFIRDKEALEAEIAFRHDMVEDLIEDTTELEAEIAGILSSEAECVARAREWSLPCLVSNETFDEVASVCDDRFHFDNYTISIEEAE